MCIEYKSWLRSSCRMWRCNRGFKTNRKIKSRCCIDGFGASKNERYWSNGKNSRFSKSIKIIALTSHDREEEVVAALGSGANAYCLKDIDPSKLADVIRDVYQGVCWIDSVVANLALKAIPKTDNAALLGHKVADHARIPLTERELEVLNHLVAGKSNTEIAKELIVSVHTAKAHVCSILQKMCVNDRVQAAVKAVKEGMVK